ncbi:class I SAM-dependent methyltransferase [Nocardioides sp.]|uniref:class I SAM-dependent methyltransferase n=1 Tax=Nocardioides sp. TaxID=35761 RepID=UPI002BAA45DD|nr:class I SAM-dependent methyltransferase [Nocardioides sp.]HVX55466.1 class I SAM-dependent methyltransferase [Nocardioides sp.]
MTDPAVGVIGGVTVDDRGIHVTATGTGPLVLSVEGRYVWSLTPERDGTPEAGGLLVPWPHVLHRYLDGVGRIRVADVPGVRVFFDAEVSLGSGRDRIEIVDGEGNPLSVDKVGHLTRSFAATDEGIREEILAGTERALRDLRETCGVDAYLNYGALLGAIRDGAMIAHDSDTDVCYLSRHTSPADIIMESYRIERTMRDLGWNLLRMSGGDIKLLLPLSDGRTCHIDIFVAFYVLGTFYQLGNRSGHLPREAIVPVSQIELHGHTFPAPADPEAMLAFLYGPSWRVPDPSFKYADPPAGVRRLDGWLRGFRSDMGRWTEFWTSVTARHVPRRGSAFARWVKRQLPREDALLEIGMGNGRDALYFARRGRRPVWAVDYSRGAIRFTLRRSRRKGIELRVEQLILGELRQVLTFGARLARDPHHVYARGLLGCLDAAAREQLWRLCRMGLRGAGRLLFLEFAATGPVGAEAPEPLPAGLVRRLDPEAVVAEIEAQGGLVETLWVGAGEDLFDHPDPYVCRLRVSWPRPRQEEIR